MNSKQKKTILRIIISTIFLLAITVAEHSIGFEWYIALILFLIPYFIIGYDVLWESLQNIIHGHIFDENFLMSLATVGAFVTKQFEEAVFVMLFYQIGEFFQDWAVDKSRKSISELMDVRPDYANIEKDGELIQVDPYDIQINDIIVIKPGEKIPLDGILIEGNTSVDTSALTGESMPQDVTVGDTVTSGCVNISGLIKVKVTSEFDESTVNKILELIEESSANKAKTESFITRFARYYTPIVVISAVVLAFVPPIFLGNLQEWVTRALTFLVISCPCALVISVPLTFFGGIGAASKKGILVKGSCYLESLGKCGVAVFDKTGTLTEGTFEVSSVNPINCTSDQLVTYCAYAESYSNHPIAKSVKAYYGKEIRTDLIQSYKEFSGYGIGVIVNDVVILTGNDKLMKQYNIEPVECDEVGTVLHIAVDRQYMGYIVIADKVKRNSTEAIGALKALNCKTVMLTGDKENVAKAVSNQLGIDEVHFELLPTDKVEITEALLNRKDEKSTLIFVGDGINDAPVLSRADVGIAMGGIGSDASIEAADIVIMDDDIGKISTAIGISRRTMNIVTQNIIFALGIKILFLILGALGLSNMWMAVFADVGVSVIAILNAMRALKTK